ncbi:hypothetical protein StoSoilB20_39080 [Arthrobacter sp. StoSoilB20]|nr:hypothetical protein StoSoilB20_39080 [Arthrobacter sp. StoSoilB20]
MVEWTVEKTLTELRTGIESLNGPYREVVDQLSMEDPEVHARVRDVILIWAEALGPDYEFLSTYESSVLVDTKSIKAHDNDVEQLRAALTQRDSKNIVIWSGYLLNTLKRYVSKVERVSMDHASRNGHIPEAALKARDDSRRASLLEARIEQAEMSQELRAGLLYARTTVKELEAAAVSARTAAGFVSGAKLTDRFEKLSKYHLRSALLFRCLTVAGVALGIVGSFVLGFVPGASHGGTTTTGDAIIRISLLGAVLGLATYFGRQAAYHRDLGTWARTIKEQLLTFDGYVEPLTDVDLRNHLRAAFASRVFGSSPDSKEDAGVSLSSNFMSELLAAVGKSAAKP